MVTAAEQKVKNLARLKSNCVCANCGTEKKLGFGSVCQKYRTFVCNECKSSHQAISHLCKSITMSAWSDQEAAALEAGGNDVARMTWLKHAPPVGSGGRPQQGCDLNVYKRFVVDVYESKRYYGEADAGAAAAASATRTAAPVQAPVAPAASQRQRPQKPRVVPQAAPAYAAPPVADLLDFSAPAPAPFSAATNSTSAPAADMFAADFGSFQTAAAPTPAASNHAANTNDHDFGSFQQHNATTSTLASGPLPPRTTTTSTPNNSFAADFADFALPTHGNPTPPSTPVPAPTVTSKKPIMGNSHNANSAISMMTQQQPQQMKQQQQQQMMMGGMPGNMNNGMMMMNSNNTMNNGMMNGMMMNQGMNGGSGVGGMNNGMMMMNNNNMNMNNGMNSMNGASSIGRQQQPMMNGSANNGMGMMMNNNSNMMAMNNNNGLQQPMMQPNMMMNNGMNNNGMNNISMMNMNQGMNQMSFGNNNVNSFGNNQMQNNGRKS
jgi:hypothetical protein